jgi:hypothetical protein
VMWSGRSWRYLVRVAGAASRPPAWRAPARRPPTNRRTADRHTASRRAVDGAAPRMGGHVRPGHPAPVVVAAVPATLTLDVIDEAEPTVADCLLISRERR